MTTTSKRRGGRRRANGEGTAYRVETPAGVRWEVKIYDERGRRVKRRFATEREARATLDDARRRRNAGLAALPERQTMGELFSAWLDQLRDQVSRGERSPNTWKRREEIIRNYMRPDLGRIECRRLTVQDVERYLGRLNAAPYTRAQHRSMLRRALNLALKWEWVDRNVVQQSDAIAVRPRTVTALSIEEAQALLEALKSSPLHSAFVVALFTGLRAGELAGLRIEDVNLDAAAARVHQQIRRNPLTRELEVAPLKTYASADRVELIPAVVEVLRDQIGERTTGYVWESAPGRPYWTTSLNHGFTSALSRAGLPHLRLHDLRHFFISFLPQLDVHPAVAQKLARHATVTTTMNVYTSVEDGLKKQAMDKLHMALSQVVGPSVGPSEVRSVRLIG
jgi:integrase